MNVYCIKERRDNNCEHRIFSKGISQLIIPFREHVNEYFCETIPKSIWDVGCLDPRMGSPLML